MNEELVRAAVEEAELVSLRMALYQAVGDPEIAAMRLEMATVRGGQGALPVLAREHHARLRQLAARFLLERSGSFEPSVPPDAEIDRLIRMAHGGDVADEALAARRPLLSFGEFPRQARWTPGERTLPPGFRVIVVGAGFSGIAMAVQLELIGIPYTVLERRPEVGGVWSTNTYPDARVDTLSATYQYGFEKNYPWTEHFARQSEVRGYLEHVAKKYGVYEHIEFGHDLTAATFDEKTATWSAQVRTGDGGSRTLRAAVIITASGLFATPRELDIAGAEAFGGDLVHSTQWGPEHSAAGRRVAVIGNGSTGVQLLAPIAREADHVYVFQRTPQWISPRERYGQPVSASERFLLDAMPYYWNWTRYHAVMPLFGARELLVPDPQWIAGGGLVNERNDRVREGLTDYIRAQTGDRPDLVAKLIPGYAPMARRPVVDNGWYASLTRDNVELVTEPVERITEHGIATADGRVREVGVIVAAIGFQTARYLHPAVYRGAGGVTLDEEWAEQGPRAHIGMTVPGFPNFFMLYGPNSQPISGGAALPAWYEIWSGYIARLLIAMLEGGHRRVAVKREAYEAYNRHIDETAAGLVYLVDSGSRDDNYYVHRGRLSVNAPWEGEEYHALAYAPNMDDFDFA